MTPVVLVGGTVSFLAAPTPPYGVTDIFTAGQQTNPAIGTVLADTGALPVGVYSLQLEFNASETNNFDLEWRNALNTATLATIAFRNIPDDNYRFLSRFNVLNDNERFRFLTVSASNVGALYVATILART